MWQPQGKFLHRAPDRGLNLFVHPTEKFKTTTVKLYCHHVLDSNAARNALLTFLLRQGTRTCPDARSIARHLESLFGATLDLDVFKIGERQVVALHLQVLNDRFAKDSTLLRRAVQFLGELLTKPRLERDEGFTRGFFEQEKRNLVRLLESKIEDRHAYASDRLIEEMCRDEPYGIHELGTVDEVSAITRDELSEHYASWRETVPIDAFVVGDVEPESVADAFEDIWPRSRSRMTLEDLPGPVSWSVSESKCVHEACEARQAVLGMGYRIVQDDTRPTNLGFLYCDAVLGGGTFSKLFRNVREAEGLAYYAGSSFERIKGLLTIHAGIADENYERTLRIVKREVRAMRHGAIDDFELESARQSFLHRIRSIGDHPLALVRATLLARIAGTPMSLEKALARHEAVQKDDLVEAARCLVLDTVYFLGKRRASRDERAIARWRRLSTKTAPVTAETPAPGVPSCV